MTDLNWLIDLSNSLHSKSEPNTLNQYVVSISITILNGGSNLHSISQSIQCMTSTEYPLWKCYWSTPIDHHKPNQT